MSQLINDTIEAYNLYLEDELSLEEIEYGIEAGLISESLLLELDATMLSEGKSQLEKNKDDLDHFGDKEYSKRFEYTVYKDRKDVLGKSSHDLKKKLKGLSNTVADMKDGADLTRAMANRSGNLAKRYEDDAKKKEEKMKSSGFIGKLYHGMKKNKYENLAKKLRRNESDYKTMESGYRKGMDAEAKRDIH